MDEKEVQRSGEANKVKRTNEWEPKELKRFPDWEDRRGETVCKSGRETRWKCCWLRTGPNESDTDWGDRQEKAFRIEETDKMKRLIVEKEEGQKGLWVGKTDQRKDLFYGGKGGCIEGLSYRKQWHENGDPEKRVFIP